MNQQIIEHGPNHHHPKVGPNGVGPEKLDPGDFYWWSMEQSRGVLGEAARSVDSPEDALKFAVGMRQERIETAQCNHYTNTARAVGAKIEEALVSTMQPDDEYTPEHSEKNDIWVAALNELYGTTAEISSSSESILRELDRSIEEITEARVYIEQLLEQAGEQTSAQFPLDDRKIKDLNLIADGFTVKEHSTELEADEPASNNNKIAKRREKARKALRAESMPHAVRLGIEYGVISYDVPSDSTADAGIDPVDREILELYSRGFYAKDIAAEKEIDRSVVDARLSQMVKNFGAKNRQHLVKRAFEEGVLTPDEPKVPHQLQGSLRFISRAEQDLISARNYIAGFGESAQQDEVATSSESAGEAEGITTENIPSRYPTLEYVLGEQSEVAGRLTNSIFKLYGDVYASMAPVLRPLNSNEQNEAELASAGVKIIDRTDERAARIGMTAQRMSMLDKLGTKSMAYAMRIMIENGMLPMRWAHPKEQIDITDSLLIEMLEFASHGGSDPNEFDSTGSISKQFGYSEKGLGTFVRRAKDMLSAEDWASMVRRAFEEGLIVPDGPLGNLQNAQQHTVEAQRHIASAGNMLSKLDADEIINYLFPPEADNLTELEMQELQRIAEGTSARDSSTIDNTTYGAIRNRRESAKSKLGAKNLTEAVAIAIRQGRIDTKNIAKKGPKPELDEETIEVFRKMAKGTPVQDAFEKKMPRPTKYSRMRKARREISANDNAHAVAILIKRGVLS